MKLKHLLQLQRVVEPMLVALTRQSDEQVIRSNLQVGQRSLLILIKRQEFDIERKELMYKVCKQVGTKKKENGNYEGLKRDLEFLLKSTGYDLRLLKFNGYCREY